VKSTIERIEREVELVRRKDQGVMRFEKAERVLAAEFVHTTSRLARDESQGGVPDPQLHSHVVVIAAERTDGKLAAVESKQLFRSARENGAWYRSELAANLRELGLGIDRRTGRDGRYFEVKGVSRELAERWSARARDVDRAAALFRSRYGRDPKAGELGALTVQTRGSKRAAATVDVSRAWEAIGQEYGSSRTQTQALFTDQAQTAEQRADLRRDLPAAVTERRSMVTQRELTARAYELSTGACRPEEAQRVVNELARSGELVRLREGMWTTRELREREQAAIRTVKARTGENAAPVTDQALREARQTVMRAIGGPLTGEQKDALERITGPGGIGVLVGQAGTGKGVVIRTAGEAWRKEGYEVIGTAIAGATAKRLGADAKLERTMTTDALLHRVEKGHLHLDSKSVVVMDEAGLC
jgi:conjugative relaxase-like TrwC/TraI family protein